MPIEGQSPELARIAEQLTKENFGIGLSEATAKGICIACKEPAMCYSEAGRREYYISGMCERCFDEAFEESGTVECEYCHKTIEQEAAYPVEHHMYCSYECYGHDVGF